MAALHTALASLGPEEFSNIPASGDKLDKYISDLLSQSELLIESVPLPLSADDSNNDDDVKRQRLRTEASIASNASEVSLSTSRSAPPSSDFQELQTQWGKPLKIKSQENSLGMTVYKAAGKDGRGAWFARRSVHEGLSFSRWQRALEDEFAESIKAGTEPGAGSIRGIGAERQVEDIHIEGQGRIQVFQLSAQFPGPTTPRDFVTLLITSSNALRRPDNGKSAPRHYMIISKPCIHEKCPPRQGLIRGQYQSVELIREVPKNGSHDDSQTNHVAQEGSDTNPVEWIMITRSDPGGSVPKFMVERGTPSSICGDAVKFLNWATQQNEGDTIQRHRSLPGVEEDSGAAEAEESSTDTDADPHVNSVSQPGAVSAAATAVANSLENYAPQAVLNLLPGHDSQQQAKPNRTLLIDKDDDTTSTISSASFTSAESHVSSSSRSNHVSEGKDQKGHKKEQSRHEKELQKIEQRRRDLDRKITAAREKALHASAYATPPAAITSSTTSLNSHEKTVQHEQGASRPADLPSTDTVHTTTPTAETKRVEEALKKKSAQAEEQRKKISKIERDLKKQEERYKKEIGKLDAKRQKEFKRVDEAKKKEDRKDLERQMAELKKMIGELDKENSAVKKEFEKLKGENEKLRLENEMLKEKKS